MRACIRNVTNVCVCVCVCVNNDIVRGRVGMRACVRACLN